MCEKEPSVDFLLWIVETLGHFLAVDILEDIVLRTLTLDPNMNEWSTTIRNTKNHLGSLLTGKEHAIYCQWELHYQSASLRLAFGTYPSFGYFSVANRLLHIFTAWQGLLLGWDNRWLSEIGAGMSHPRLDQWQQFLPFAWKKCLNKSPITFSQKNNHILCCKTNWKEALIYFLLLYFSNYDKNY